MLTIRQFKKVIEKIFGYIYIEYRDERDESCLSSTKGNLIKYKLNCYWHGRIIASYEVDDMNENRTAVIKVYDTPGQSRYFKIVNYGFTLKRYLLKSTQTQRHLKEAYWACYRRVLDWFPENKESFINVILYFIKGWNYELVQELKQKIDEEHPEPKEENESKVS